MSLLFFEGFEGIGTASTTASEVLAACRKRFRHFDYSSSAANVVLVDNDLSDGFALRTGSSAFGYDVGVRHYFNANQESYELTCGLRFRVPNSSESGTLINIGDVENNTQLRLRCISSSELRLERGTTQIGTWTGLSGDNWYYIELVATFNNSTGTADVYVDDTSRISLSNTDTLQTANGVWSVRFGGTSIAVATTTWPAIDDLYILNNQGSNFNSKLGKGARVYWSYPDGDEGTNDFSPSSGTDHYAMVDETPESDSDYLSDSGTAQVELFDMSSISGVDVQAVKPEVIYKLQAAGKHDMRIKGKDGSNTKNGTTVPIIQANNDGFVSEIMDTDPSNAAWTTSSFNAVKLGFEQV